MDSPDAPDGPSWQVPNGQDPIHIGGILDITEMNYRSHLLIERRIKEDIPLNKKTQGRYFAREKNRGRYDTDSA